MLFAMAGDEFFQVFARFRDVFPQSLRSQFGIFCPAGSEKFAVRPASPMQVTGKNEVETSVTVTVNI